jgi:hypothetical protein
VKRAIARQLFKLLQHYDARTWRSYRWHDGHPALKPVPIVENGPETGWHEAAMKPG